MKTSSMFKKVSLLCAAMLGITVNAAITPSPKSQSFDANGGTGSFTLTISGGNFSYRTPFDVSGSWITQNSTRLNLSSGVGTLTVNYTVAPNTASSSRSGYISGAFGGETFRFEVSQAFSKKFKVTFGKNGGAGGDDYVTATYGQPMPTPRTAPTKAGWTFGGYWDTTGAGGKQYYDANMRSVRNWDKTSDATLWAKWTAAPTPSSKTYKVTFGKNGGTGGDNYVTATYGQSMPTPRTAPKKAGWTFGGYWDTLACDARGDPLGKQYYNAKMESVRAWDKSATGTLWAKWTCRVKLGKNGGTGGDDYVTVIYGQPFPTRTMPTRVGYAFGGYFVSASSKTGQCYNADGTGTSTMKWTTGGSPTIWALWWR